MKRVDENEIFSPNEDNHFDEFKNFPAERYFLPETEKSPEEIIKIAEITNDSETKKNDEASSLDLKDIQDGIDRNVTKPIDSVSSSSSGASEAAAKAVAGAGSAGTAAAAVVVTTSILAASLFPFIGDLLSFSIGSDYALLEVDSSAIIAGDSSFSNLSASDFYIEFVDGSFQKKQTLQDGVNTYLFTGFQPNQTYKYNVVCSSLKGSVTTCYSDKITTLAASDSTNVILDSLNTYIKYDEEKDAFKLSYSLYVSDPNKHFSNYDMYVCATRPNDLSSIDSLYTDNTLNENSFFNGETTDIKLENLFKQGNGFDTESLFLCVSGKNDDLSKEIISINEISLSMPTSWSKKKIILDSESENIEYSSNNVNLFGNILYIDEQTSYVVIVSQYDENGALIDESRIKEVDFNSEMNVYSISFPVAYGTRTYKYSIYDEDHDGNGTLQYESSLKAYGEDQSYDATYSIIEPKDMSISYENDMATISFNPSYSSIKNNLYYKVEVLDGDEILDTYSGVDEAYLNVPVSKLSSALHFIYYDAGSFGGKEVIYRSRKTSSYVFGYPEIILDPELSLMDGCFAINYECSMPFDYASASLSLEIDNGETTIIQEVDEVLEKGMVLINEISGELGDATINAKLTFKDNQSNQATHTNIISSQTYSLNYLFGVTDVIVDMTSITSDSTSLPVTVCFKAPRIPSSYSVNAYGNDNTLLGSTDIETGYVELNGVSMTEATSLRIDVQNGDGEVWKSYTYTIDYSSAKENYSEATNYDLVTPINSVVTYNEDGTVNIYRDLNFEPSKSGQCYNAMVYSYDENGTPLEKYNCIGTNRYAVLEDLPLQPYYFAYYDCFEYDGVIYQMNKLQDFVDTTDPILAFRPTAHTKIAFSTTANESYLNITLTNAYFVNPIVTVNGKEYTLDEEFSQDMYQGNITIDEVISIQSVIVNASLYSYYYDTYKEDIEMKGSPSYEVSSTLERLDA